MRPRVIVRAVTQGLDSEGLLRWPVVGGGKESNVSEGASRGTRRARARTFHRAQIMA